MMRLSEEQVRWFRLGRSGLVDPFDSPGAAASALVGVQAQILPAAGLSLWNRTEGLTHCEYDALIHEQRSLVKLWGQRGTLHLYPSEEWPLLYGAMNRQSTWWERRAARLGGDVESYRALVARIADMLRERGTIGRSDLRAAELPLETWHLSGWGGIFADLVYSGVACHAGSVGNEGRFAHREHWLPDLEWDPPANEAANQAILRRYLHTYGPATIQDFAYWRGTRVTLARQWLEAIRDEVAEVEVDGQTRLVLAADRERLAAPPPPPEEWPVRLLYRFDPLLLGHKSKAWVVAPHYYNHVWRPAGHIEGTLLEHGRIAGTWRYDRKGSGLVVTLRPFEPLSAPTRAAVERLAGDVAAFFELPLRELVVRDPAETGGEG